MEYWDDKDIAEARANGITYNAFYARVYHYGWSVEKAKTLPVMSRAQTSRKYSEDIMKLAKENGISKNLFYKRVNRMRWNEKRAATEPVPTNRKYPKEYCDRAIANGVSVRTFHRRLSEGWTLEEATKPPLSKSESAKRAMKKRWAKENFNYAKSN